MLTIHYPEPAFRIQAKEGSEQIFDPLRKKWIRLTPEEWVRQNFVQYLLQVKNYPATLIAMEKKIRLGELTKRFDVLIYDSQHQPWMMIECKAGSVKLDREVLEQVLRYNISVPVTYIIVTNGNDHYGWIKRNGNLDLIQEMPDY